MQNKSGNYVLIGMVLGAVLGAIGGYFFGGVFIELKFLGTLFLNALKMVVVPLIVASMIVGVTSLGNIKKLGRTTGKTLLYYLTTTSAAVLIGIILVNIIQPGVGIGSIGNTVPDMVAQTKPTGFSDFIVNLIPENIIAAAAKGSVLPLIIFSLVFGGVLTAIGSKGKPVIDFFIGLNTAIMKIVILIIYFAPIGILAIIGSIVAENRGSLSEIASGLGMYSLTVIIGLLIHAVIILPLILKYFGRKKPVEYFLNMGQALTTAFTTASSSATLPLTMESVTEKNKVNPKASAFVLPLGATINMDGTALYEAVAAIFIAQAIGYPLSIGAQTIIFLTATLASIGAAAIPHAGLVTMVIVLSAVGLPLEGIGFIFAVDWFLDRCRTTVNVWGDSIGAAVIGETAEIKTYLRPDQKTKPVSPRKPPSRKSKPRTDKPVRDFKPADRDKAYRPKDDRTRDRKPINGRSRPERSERPERSSRPERSTRPERAPRPRREPERKTREAANKEPWKNVQRPAPRVQPEKEIKKEPIKENIVVTHREADDFFGSEFKKINFFNDDQPDATPI
jgi:solute carrier family 1 (high affinity glutamate transporter) protein 1